MAKITMHTAQTLIGMYTNVYINTFEKYYHVHDIHNKIIMEVNIASRFAKLYLDYAHNDYVSIPLPWGDEAFKIRHIGDDEYILTVSVEGLKTRAIYSFEIVA